MEAVSLSTLYGLEGLTIGRLAELTGLSKSGLFAHFGSKENLQLAIVSAAMKIAYLEYTRPVMGRESSLERLWGLCDYFLSFVERRVFPGGCFFSAVTREMPILPDSVREQIEKHQRGWKLLIRQCAEEAIQKGELKTELDAKQLTFELHAFVVNSNVVFNISPDNEVIERAWDGVRRLLGDLTRPRGR